MAKTNDYKIKICVSGTAEMSFLSPQDYEIAKELGREVVRQGAVLVTGATTGFPLWVAMGAKEAGGVSIGFSPASTEKEHVEVYRLPVEYMDLIVYTGFGYSGRNLLVTRSADAVIEGPGRIGTINEFTDAYEDGKPIAILKGDWDTDEILKLIMDKSHKQNDNVVFGSSPKEVVAEVIEMVIKQRSEINRVYTNSDHIGGTVGERIL